MSLLDQARNKQVKAWVPENANDGIVGTVISVSFKESEFQAGVMIPTVLLLTDDGERYNVTGFRSVLRKEIEQENPEPGDRMAAVYSGVEKLKTGKFAGRDVHIYKVVVEKAKTAGSGDAEAHKSDKVPF